MTRAAIAGLVILGCLLLACACAPWLAPADPLAIDVPHRFSPPSAQHPLGSDEFGRDLWARLLAGGRTSLGLAIAATLAAAFVGIPVGTGAALASGAIEQAVLLASETLAAFPGNLLALLLVSLAGPSSSSVVLALSLVYAPVFIKLSRTEAARLRQADFVLAARLLGASELRILFGEILPNMVPALAAQAVTTFGWALVAETSLSFLGLGAQPPAPSWGAILAEARDFLDSSSLLALAPALAIFTAVWSANLLGSGFSERRP